MAQGDVKVAMSSIAASTNWVVQPPAGEEWIIKRVFSVQAIGTSPDKIADAGFAFYDGTNISGAGKYDIPESSILLYQPPLQHYVNNTIYFVVRNAWGSGAAIIGYCGIQIK